MAKIKHGFSRSAVDCLSFLHYRTSVEQPVGRRLGRTLYGVFSEGGKTIILIVRPVVESIF